MSPYLLCAKKLVTESLQELTVWDVLLTHSLTLSVEAEIERLEKLIFTCFLAQQVEMMEMET